MPRIVKLVPRRKGQWLELVPDEGPALRLPLHAVPAGIAAGVELDEPDWAGLGQRASYFAVYDRALRILSLREHFALELERKLFGRSRDGAAIRQVIGELRQRSYLDDHRAAEYVAEFIARRGAVGPRLLFQELSRRGCPPELVAELVERHAAAQAEEDSLGRLIESKRRGWAGKADQLRRKLEAKGDSGRRFDYQLRAQLGASIMAWLAVRGFGGEEVREKVQRLVEELLQ
jgi:regulatory protein